MAIASSSRPPSRSALPRLLYAAAKSGRRCDCPAVSGDCLVEPALSLEGVAEVVVRLGHVGLELDGLLISGDRLVEAALQRQGIPQVGMDIRQVGPKPKRPQARRERLVGPRASNSVAARAEWAST